MATKKNARGRKVASQRAGPKKKASSKLARTKVRMVMKEYKEGKLHSRSISGPTVKSRKQAIAIALSEAGISSKKRSSKRSSTK